MFAESGHYSKYLCGFKLDHAEYLFYANTRLYYHSLRNWNSLDASRWTNKYVFAKMISERTSRSFCHWIKSFTSGATCKILKALKPHIVNKKIILTAIHPSEFNSPIHVRLCWLSCKGRILMQHRILDSKLYYNQIFTLDYKAVAKPLSACNYNWMVLWPQRSGN